MLKRTCCPFFGKAESHATRAAIEAHQRGDYDGAKRIHAAVSKSRENRYQRHVARGFRAKRYS